MDRLLFLACFSAVLATVGLHGFPMLKGKDRLCDVCGDAIARGEKYAVVKVPKAKAGLFHALTESKPDMAATVSVDSHGNLRLDVCLACRLNMQFPGHETVQ